MARRWGDGVTKTPSQIYSVDERIQVWEDGAKLCHYCDKRLPKPGTKSGRATHFDHVIAQAKGGSDELDNLVVCCKRCNTEKGSTEYLAFLHGRAVRAETQLRRLNTLIVAYHAKQP